MVAHGVRGVWEVEQCSVVVVGDASDKVFSSFLLNRELGPGRRSECITPFTEAQLRRMAAGEFSSAERELEATRLAVAWLDRCGLLRGRLVQYCTDAQNAYLCVVGMKGSGPNLGLVLAIYSTLFAAGADITMVWRPRTDPQQQHAEWLTKAGAQDSTQWLLNRRTLDGLLRHPCLGGRLPDFDLFADPHSCCV